MSFDDNIPKETQPQTQQQPQQPKIPQDSQKIIDVFQNVVEKPNDVDTLWSFVRDYLTYLENKSAMVKPFFDKGSPSLMMAIKKASMQDVPWGVYNCFLTISNIGSTIAQQESLDDKDKYYIMYVMLSFDSDSPVYQFTQLLQTLQTQDDETKEVYSKIDSKFKDAFKKYDNPTQEKQTITSKSTSLLNKTFTIAGKQISAKVLLIVLVIILLIVGMGGAYYFYKKSPQTVSLPKSVGPPSVASDGSSIMS